MATFEITGPDGGRYRITAPDENSAMSAFSQLGIKPTVQTERKAQGVLGKVDAAVRGVADTLTFGLADEFAAKMGSLTGIGGKQGEYDANLAQQRALDKADNEVNFLPRLGGQIVGAIATPIGAGVRTVKGLAGVGAATGGAYGFGSGEGVDDRVAQAAMGAAIGGTVGAAIPKVIGAGASAIDGAQRVAQGVGGLLRAGSSPADEAARRAGMALRSDLQAAGRTGADAVGDLATMQAQGAPAIVADVGGGATGRLARQAVNTSPEAGNAFHDKLASRFITQTQRVEDNLADASGSKVLASGNTGADLLDTLRAKARAENKTAYNRAYAQAPAVWDEGMSQLMQAPAMQQAAKDATRRAANNAAVDGFRPIKNPFVFDETGVKLTQNADGSQALPSLQYWDVVKRGLDDQIESARRAGNNAEAADVSQLRRTLLDRLDYLAPAYKDARGGAAKFFGAEDAFEAGSKMALSRMKNDEFARGFSKMTGAEKDLFKEGFVTKIRDVVREVGDNRDVMLKDMFASPAGRTRIEIALGKDGAAKLEMFARHEGMMNDLRRAVGGNSTTAGQLSDIAAANREMPQGIVGWVREVARNVRADVNEKVAVETARLLTSTNPKDVERILSAASKQPALRDFVRRLDAGVSRGIGFGSGGVSNSVSEPLRVTVSPMINGPRAAFSGDGSNAQPQPPN